MIVSFQERWRWRSPVGTSWCNFERRPIRQDNRSFDHPTTIAGSPLYRSEIRDIFPTLHYYSKLLKGESSGTLLRYIYVHMYILSEKCGEETNMLYRGFFFFLLFLDNKKDEIQFSLGRSFCSTSEEIWIAMTLRKRGRKREKGTRRYHVRVPKREERTNHRCIRARITGDAKF